MLINVGIPKFLHNSNCMLPRHFRFTLLLGTIFYSVSRRDGIWKGRWIGIHLLCGQCFKKLCRVRIIIRRIQKLSLPVLSVLQSTGAAGYTHTEYKAVTGSLS